MPSHLIAISDLTFDSWKFFSMHWKELLKKAAWFIPGFLVYIGFALLAEYTSQDWLMPVGFLLLLATEFAVFIQLSRTIIALDAPENLSATVKSLPLSHLFLPTLLITLLAGLISLLGGIAFILPGIWLAISLCFSPFFLLEENIRGVDTLKHSYRLVKGHWWATFGRLLVTRIFFGLLFVVIGSFVTIVPLIVLILGSLFFSSLLVNGSLPLPFLVPAVILGVVLGLIFLAAYATVVLSAMCMKLIVLIKLFHSLKSSQTPTDKK